MKKISVFLFMFMMCSVSLMAAEAAEPVVEEAANAWATLGFEVLALVIKIFTPTLIVLASWATWKLAKKLGVEKTEAMDVLLRKYVKEGINWADAWAAKQASKPTGENKKVEAIKHIVELIKSSPLPEMAEEKIAQMVEAQLAYDKKNENETAPTTING